MFNFCTNNSIIKLLAVTSLLTASSSVFANNKAEDQITEVLSTIPTSQTQSNSSSLNRSVPNSSVVLDFSVAQGESWDAKDSSNNVLVNCVNGTTITGFEYTNVTINTSSGSFFSEAVMYFSDSNNGNNGLRLTTGAGDETSGTKTFSSSGILDLTDNGLEDIISLNDGKFVTELYENIDDVENSIDARYTNGTVTVWGVDLVPTTNCPFIVNNGDGGGDSDLSVVYTSNQQSNPNLNESIEFNITINNNGDNPATNVQLNNTLSDKLSFSQMSCNDGTSTTNFAEIDSLNVQDIANDDSLICTLEATVVAYGIIENSVNVTADNDSNSSNNSALVMIGGAFRVVPINNYFALLLLALTFMYFARKRIS